jgi:hypothetical protein
LAITLLESAFNNDFGFIDSIGTEFLGKMPFIGFGEVKSRGSGSGCKRSGFYI